MTMKAMIQAATALLLSSAHVELRTLLRGDHVDVWELFCGPTSWLTAACEQESLKCQRINLHQVGYDLYKPATYDRPST